MSHDCKLLACTDYCVARQVFLFQFLFRMYPSENRSIFIGFRLNLIFLYHVDNKEEELHLAIVRIVYHWKCYLSELFWRPLLSYADGIRVVWWSSQSVLHYFGDLRISKGNGRSLKMDSSNGVIGQSPDGKLGQTKWFLVVEAVIFLVNLNRCY
jgi:hypothetical protein